MIVTMMLPSNGNSPTRRRVVGNDVDSERPTIPMSSTVRFSMRFSIGPASGAPSSSPLNSDSVTDCIWPGVIRQKYVLE